MAAAQAVGGSHDVIVTQNISDYGQNIQAFIDQDFDVIVTVGFLIGTDTAKAAKANPDVKFIGVDQGVCLDEQGEPDPTFACAGDAATLLPNYQGIVFAEEQPGYLAGIVAASITKTGTIAAVGGTNVPPWWRTGLATRQARRRSSPTSRPCTRRPTPIRPRASMTRPKGKAIAQQFISQDADVIFQIAGLTGQGALEAACAADDVWGIGVDVDQALSIPTVAECVVTSAEKKLKETVQAVVTSVANDTFKAGTVLYDAASEPPAIGLSPFHDNASLITPDIQALLDKATAEMKAGTLKPPRTVGE
jgi:basic membrane protein A